jgi:hypothetical protein
VFVLVKIKYQNSINYDYFNKQLKLKSLNYCLLLTALALRLSPAGAVPIENSG